METASLPFPVASIVADTEVGRILFPGTGQNQEANRTSVSVYQALGAAKRKQRDFGWNA